MQEHKPGLNLDSGRIRSIRTRKCCWWFKKGSEELADSDDLSRKARLLAIQEKIEKDKAVELAKLKNKDVTTSQIRNYEYQIGLGKSPEEASKIAFGPGENIQARESEEDIRLMERKIIKTEGSGFEKANITGYEQAAVESTVYGVPTVPYIHPNLVLIQRKHQIMLLQSNWRYFIILLQENLKS